MDIVGWFFGHDPIVIDSQRIELTWLAVRILISLGLVWIFDKISGLDWKEKIVPNLERSPVAGGIFYAAVVLAIAKLATGH